MIEAKGLSQGSDHGAGGEERCRKRSGVTNQGTVRMPAHWPPRLKLSSIVC